MSADAYPRALRWLHWLLAPMVAAQFALGWIAEHASDRKLALGSLQAHLQLGLLVLVLMLARVAIRLAQAAPHAPGGLAGCVHALLYALLFALPASGYVGWVWMQQPLELWGWLSLPPLFQPPVDDETWRARAWYVHLVCAWLLAALVLGHVSAALWHQWVLRDARIARRMRLP